MSKPQKSKQELRAMIPERIVPYSPGMDVSIRATHNGWNVDYLPPTTRREPHRDCFELIAKVATTRRAEFDLAP